MQSIRSHSYRKAAIGWAAAGVELKAELNVLVFEVVDETVGWQSSVRFTDAAGQPVKGIRVTLVPEARDSR